MNNMAVVVVGYNRIPGMIRLLESLEAAHYGNDKVDLIVSLDNCGSDSVEKAARAFQWSHGEKIVRTFLERQGLRKHILACGDYLRQYEAIAVFEDDLVVSPAYYEYMKQTVQFYKENDDIAGISLFSHKINVNTYLPFTPDAGINDVFYLQFAQSWGQIWLREQWFKFKEWYEQNEEIILQADNVPEFVSNWPKTSWLKYHIKYCIENNKYFVYPYISLTTCFSDAGEHSKETNTTFQVPMQTALGKVYALSDKMEELVRYDAFFERQGLSKYLGVPEKDLMVDLYGTKKIGRNRYLLTRKMLPYRVCRSYALCMRPHEHNVMLPVKGDDIFLYDTEVRSEAKKGKGMEAITVSYYYNLTANWRMLISYIGEKIGKKIRKK